VTRKKILYKKHSMLEKQKKHGIFSKKEKELKTYSQQDYKYYTDYYDFERIKEETEGIKREVLDTADVIREMVGKLKKIRDEAEEPKNHHVKKASDYNTGPMYQGSAKRVYVLIQNSTDEPKNIRVQLNSGVCSMIQKEQIMVPAQRMKDLVFKINIREYAAFDIRFIDIPKGVYFLVMATDEHDKIVNGMLLRHHELIPM